MRDATLYNREVKTLAVVEENGSIIDIVEVYNFENLPLMLQKKLDLKSINRWLSTRKMPLTREGLEDAIFVYGDKPYTNYGHMFSLSDQYWLKFTQKDSWKKHNFFTNQYSSAVGQSLFEPWTVNKRELNKESPDLTTAGRRKKVWVQDETTHESYMIKAGSEELKMEPLSEILASMLLSKLHIIKFQNHYFETYGLSLCSKHKNFVKHDTEYIRAADICDFYDKPPKEKIYNHLIKSLETFGVTKPKVFIDRMILVDFLMGNNNRSLEDFGVIRNIITKEVYMAPLYNFGTAFFPEHGKVQNLFKDEIARVTRSYGKLTELKALENTKDLFTIIDQYPLISKEEKEQIKEDTTKRFHPFIYEERERSRSK